MKRFTPHVDVYLIPYKYMDQLTKLETAVNLESSGHFK